LLFRQFTDCADECELLVFDVFLEHVFLNGRGVASITLKNPSIEESIIRMSFVLSFLQWRCPCLLGHRKA